MKTKYAALMSGPHATLRRVDVDSGASMLNSQGWTDKQSGITSCCSIIEGPIYTITFSCLCWSISVLLSLTLLLLNISSRLLSLITSDGTYDGVL